MSFVATAYCQGGKTASGAHTNGAIVAADPDVLPIGTRIRVSGLKRGRDGIYRVMDTGTGVRGRRIDLFVENCAEARRFGRQHVRVAVVQRRTRDWKRLPATSAAPYIATPMDHRSEEVRR